MSERLRVVSISYKNAPLEIRERLALNESETKAFYLKLKDVLGLTEALVLSTCNRTEVYYKSEEKVSTEIIKLLAAQKGILSSEIITYFEYVDDEQSAISYLFEVSLGLHSQVVGDQQIINQVKLAYQWSADMDMAGPFIHRVLHAVFFANKRLVQETSFRDGAASTSYVTVDLMESFLPMLSNPKILVLGLGEIGEDVAKTLFEKNITNVTVCNRTKEKSLEIAEKFAFEVLEFESLISEIGHFDVVVSSVRAEKPIIKKSFFNNNKSVKYLFDLSVPRSIEPDIDNVAGLVLYGLDEIQKRTDNAIEKRLEAIPEVKSIINEMVVDVENWSKELLVSPTIHKLKNALETIRQEEMSRYLKSMSVEEADKMDKITSAMMQKIIKLPVLQLKAACKRGEADTLIDVLNDLFDLEKVKLKN
ncbi:glutamyl-tRNA reductase [Lacihabitans sp. LS3-19]|uniref:glutamyl-tRNA reductase n=1 Tax=Lacihabitans sp. LS3-19 TaxID=2487335 RepID=UPI0020CE0861|nr:glutamyl-tRNA reductase [Lacihabitans sp. LS3-19]MCP9766583.1 glutamyl-tRNA reductase [Lacihabitans sp. LS3-19]